MLLSHLQSPPWVLGLGLGSQGRPPVALAVSRALGDREFKLPKPIVSCVPSVQTFELSPEDTHLLLVCDGLTDVRPPISARSAAILKKLDCAKKSGCF